MKKGASYVITNRFGQQIRGLLVYEGKNGTAVFDIPDPVGFNVENLQHIRLRNKKNRLAISRCGDFVVSEQP